MWTLLLWLACTVNEAPKLPEAGVEARRALALKLRERDPKAVSLAAEHAAQWEGQDAQLDRLLGDALANVLMNPNDGLQLLQANPKPGDPEWEAAYLSAASRTGDSELMQRAWAESGRLPLNFSHPVVLQVRQQMLADPLVGMERMETALLACALLDAQPPVGRQALDHPVSSTLLDVAEAVGGTHMVLARPIFQTDPDPQSGRGPIQCQKKVWLENGWPEPFPRALTVALTDSVHSVYVDIRLNEGETWAFAASDATAGGRWLEAMKLWETPGGPERVREKYADGLWVSAEEKSK